MRPWTNKSTSLGTVGLLLIILGTSLCFFWPTLYQQILQKGLALSPSSKSFDVWNDTSSLPPMYLEIYFFNWTNPEELTTPGKKPAFTQVGPYTFAETRQKVNITFHPENHTVSYFQRRFWYFDEKRSNGSLRDNITHLNVVAVSAAHKIRYWSYFMQESLSYLLLSSKVHIVKTVDELLFKGYDDTIIKMGKIAAAEEEVPFDRFGWFYTRNGSADFDGNFNMDTGEGDINNFGVLKQWNYKDTTKFHKSPCNVVEGSAGEFWPPNRTKDDIVLFSADLCRPIMYEYVETVSHMDIEGYRYAIGEKTLGNDTRRRYPHEQAKYFEPTTTTEDFYAAEHSAMVTDPPQDDPDVVNMGQCYCNGDCNPIGMINVSSCRYGAPVFVSLPHFNKGDQSLRDQVVGMNPDDKDHSFYITLEPNTGIPLEVAARLQVNILLQSSKTVSLFKNVPKVYFPIFWFSLKVQITDEMSSGLKQLLMLPTICVYVGAIMVIIGVTIIFTISLLYIIRRQRMSQLELKSGKVESLPDKKSELMYLDKVTLSDDQHIRNDRRLYPNLY